METAADRRQDPISDAPRRISVLGATGSVGESTLDLIARDPLRFDVVALTANANWRALANHAIALDAEVAVVADESHYSALKEALAGTNVEAAAGEGALIEAGARPADWIMAAISGAAGLAPTFAAARQGSHLALANKECLVSAGNVFMDCTSRAGTSLLPVDSEHSAAFQAIDHQTADSIERIVLTASGGPFRTWPAERLADVRPEDALKHPNWTMGRKITVDSATLMNKGLELIEAFFLFPVSVDQLDVVIHPQSIVHCLVEYQDGSVLAQMSSPDMRTPIAYSLAWPDRMWCPTERLDLIKIGQLSFEEPDMNRFPALRVAREALAEGGGAPTVLNAANEIAVEAFLDGRLGFKAIPALVEKTLEVSVGHSDMRVLRTMDDVIHADKAARRLARSLLETVSES